MKIITPRHVDVTIRRPNGKVETITHPKIDWFNDQILDQMRKAMADTGRGEVISYRNVDSVVEMEESDYQTKCTRCKSPLDTRTSYHQTEHMRLGGSLLDVEAHYCESCRSLLSSIGAGEITDLEHRAAHKPSYEPRYKMEEED